MSKTKEIEFIGIDSGDYESQCFDVDYETFERLEGKKPKKYDKSYFNDNTFMFYPFEDPFVQHGKKYKVKILIEEI